jgi:hypothetical protein
MKSILMTILLIVWTGRLPDHDPQPVSRPVLAGSLLISEVLSDPDPTVGLPPYEFVEWFNNGADTVDLAGWQWVVGDKLRNVPGGRLSPGGYVIVCSPAAGPAFRALGQVIVLESFPALRNTGDRLTLISPSGIAVHTVDYSSDQFTDALKVNGGWSLELTDPFQYCNPAAWLPSVDPSGGTPGRANSRQLSMPPAESPILIRAAGYDNQLFVLLFSGALNPQLNVNNYSCRLMPGGYYAPAVPSPVKGFRGLFFQYPDGLDKGVTYSTELSGTIDDCSGQPARLRPVSLGFPSEPDSADVVISEIMFDPRTDQIEFVEVYNRSERIIELAGLILARADTDGSVISFSGPQLLSYWLFSGCYAVFTADDNRFTKAWPLADPGIVAERPDMPSLTNEKSQIILMDRNQKKLDAAIYCPDWHYPYLTDHKGVSLERINIDGSGTDRINWFSASPASGGSTPGVKNSSGLQSPLTVTQDFSLNPIGYASASPNAVQVTVCFNFNDPGWFLQVNIFNSAGMPVKQILPFGLASIEGVVCWDGLDSAQRLVPDGIYIVVADYYHPTGKKGRWKRACAIVRAY